MKRPALLVGAVLALALVSAPAAAQCNAALALNGTIAPGQTVSLDVTGSTPDAFHVLAIGPNTGSTTLNFGPLGSLTVDLDTPFATLPLGFSDGNGDVSLQATIPSSIPPNAIPSFNLNAQSVGVEFTLGMMGPPSLSFCTSNVINIAN